MTLGLFYLLLTVVACLAVVFAAWLINKSSLNFGWPLSLFLGVLSLFLVFGLSVLVYALVAGIVSVWNVPL